MKLGDWHALADRECEGEEDKEEDGETECDCDGDMEDDPWV